MLLIPEAAGPQDPVARTPVRRPGSVRRTSAIDSSRPDGLAGDLVLAASARDLATGADDKPTVVAEAGLEARTDPAGRLRSLSTTPPTEASSRLIGLVVGPGFRRRLAGSGTAAPPAGSLLHLLLDDLPGAALVSGYAVQRAGGFDGSGPRLSPKAAARAEAAMATMGDDRCAGWAHDATMMVTLRGKGVMPVSQGPAAPVLEHPDDPLGWHPLDRLGPHSMRRRRRLDVVAPTAPGEPFRIDAHFRDSHFDGDGVEWVLHEYTVLASVDHRGDRVVELSAEARVLPWTECPNAVASAGRAVGMTLGELRTRVRRELVGRSTCTHLNDTLRSLDDVSALIAVLAGLGGR